MIRRRDYIRLSVQKLALRKKRAAFAIVSVALGVIVVVAVSSLMDGLRDVAVKTMWTEEIDSGEVRVYAYDNPFTYMDAEERKQKEKRRGQFLTESAFEEMRGWTDVEAADRPVVVQPISFDTFANRPRPVAELVGVPEPVLRRYIADPALLAAVTNAIPLVVGERNLRLRYDETKKKLEVADDVRPETWIGKEFTIRLGDNYARVQRFRYDYDNRQYLEMSEEEIAAGREALQRANRAHYDIAIYNTSIPLKGRVVGICPGKKVLIPHETAVLCEKWINQRNLLAVLRPGRESEEVYYGTRGRRTPRTGEYLEGTVLVRRGGDVEAVAKKVEEMGFSVATRTRTFESQARAFDSSVRVVRKAAFAFGGIVLGMACGLVWSTTSKIVSDSRVDIGLFRALGATKRDVRRLFLGEAVLQGVLGTLGGMLLGWALALWVSRWVIGFARRSVFDPEEALLIPDSIFAIDAQFCFLLLAGSAVVSLLAGLLPANRAANIDPVKALKRE